MLEMEITIRDFIEYFISVLTLERQITAHEDVKEDAQGPDVALVVVVALQHFWRHVVWSTSNALELLVSLGPLGQTEVNQLYFALLGEHDVLGLDISVHDALRVHMVASAQ